MELSKTKQSVYSLLGSRKQRLRHGLFMVEGEKSVADTLGHYKLEALILKQGFKPSLFSLEEVGEEKIRTAGEDVMKKMSSLSTVSPVMAVYCLPDESGEEYLKLEKDLYLMLDGIQDPGNLGTIVRTSHWFGIKKIFASLDTADIYNPKTIQATMGSLPHVEIVYCDLEKIIDSNPSMPVYGMLLDGENIYNSTLSDAGFILMGNEGKGIREELRKKISKGLLIPPYDKASHSESLNVAIATGITLFSFRKG